MVISCNCIQHIQLLRGKTKNELISKLMKLAIFKYSNSINTKVNLTPLELTYDHIKLRDPFEIYYDQKYYV